MKNQYEIDYQQGYDNANDEWLERIDKIRTEIEQNAYPIVHGVNNHEKGMTLYGILQIIDKYRKKARTNMADIEVVIKIPEEDYKLIKETEKKEPSNLNYIARKIITGTVLPKGHGRLIDADALGEKLNRYTEAPYQYALTVFNDALTIIEADKESKE